MSRVPFAERFEQLRARRGPFCLGLDPTPELLAAWGLPDDIFGLRSFCDKVVDAAEQHVSVIKPQSAYFERFGAAGLEVLGDAIEAIHTMGTLALLDVKRGDIGSTNSGYAEGLLGPGSAMAADAITVNAYLGFEALGPILDRAQQLGCGVFVVVRSSNPEGTLLQQAQVSPGVSVAQYLCERITDHNASAAPDGVGPIGAVVGLTADDAADIAGRLPRSLILAPGLGAQGGGFADLTTTFGPQRQRVLPSSSRGVLRSGPDLSALRDTIGEHCAQAKEALS